MKKITSLLMIIALLTMLLPAYADKGLTIQDCHRVTITYTDTTQSNASIVRLWQVDTALDAVDDEINGIARAYVEELAGGLPTAENYTDGNSRLDVGIRASRTGTTWMSFVVQARTTYHRGLTGQKITTRTYDMVTGERIMLTDIFPDDSMAWFMLGDAVYEQVCACWPDEEPDEQRMLKLISRESLEQMDFSLHGMSLVLHIPSDAVYPGHHTLMEITFYYPEIRAFMSDEARAQTDNDNLYNVIALTFDDGPERTNTTRVLNNLMSSGAVATFFVIGNRVSSFADLVQRENDEGHSVAGHNWTHGNVTSMTGERMKQIPGLLNEAVVAAIGIPVRYDRVPYGLYPRMIKAGVGMAYIQWSVDTYDWRGRSASEIISTVKKQAVDGDIILCHDIKDNTPDAVPGMVSWLEENGFMLLTIDELFAKDGVTLAPDTVYFRNADGDTTRKQR